jgi:hypothetical protein
LNCIIEVLAFCCGLEAADSTLRLDNHERKLRWKRWKGDSPFIECNDLPRSLAFFRILNTITSSVLLNDPSTPQGFAYDFLVNEDPAAVDPCTYPTVEQRYASVAFYQATNGAEWKDSSGWLSASSECEWYGVTCDGDGSLPELLLCK